MPCITTVGPGLETPGMDFGGVALCVRDGFLIIA